MMRGARAARDVVRGRACMARRDWTHAIEAFRDALAIAPRDVDAARWTVCAVEAIDAPPACDTPTPAAAWCALGAALAFHSSLPDAAIAYRQALAEAPSVEGASV